jgi:hypothetical protein
MHAGKGSVTESESIRARQETNTGHGAAQWRNALNKKKLQNGDVCTHLIPFITMLVQALNSVKSGDLPSVSHWSDQVLCNRYHPTATTGLHGF